MTAEDKPIVLLCDAAFSAVPILFALKRMGFRVAVCGSRPTDPGHGLADFSFVMDYGDREALRQIAHENGIEYLVPGCTDVSYLSCAWVAAQLCMPGYDSPESTEIIHRKDRFRALCRANGFPTPRSAASLDEAQDLRFPLLVKPGDSFSGKGIVKVRSPTELAQAIDFAKLQSKTGSVVFEEFVDGKLYSQSAFLRDGKIAADFFVNEYCTVHPYQVNSSHLCLGLRIEIVHELRQWVEAFASVLKLADGLVHTQFISDGERFYLIEVMRRCPGDLYALLIEKSTGFDYPGMYAASFCNFDGKIERRADETRFFTRHTVSVDHDCVYFSSRIALANANVSFVSLKKAGEILRAAPDRAGIYFIEHSSATEMKEIAPSLKNYITVETLGHD